MRVYEAEFDDPNTPLLVATDQKRAPSWVTPGERATLFASKEKPPLQKAFATAHGLGHLVLGHVSEGGFRIDAAGEGVPHDPKGEREASQKVLFGEPGRP